ncbi:hypothetical protein ABZ572_13400 [Streptomyces sp. NPDC018338]|uniref:hypothetical protein n=1 Tax=Streptomyces sp. NPDC018338 TaxID=3157192 RepID=UPI0033F6D7B0
MAALLHRQGLDPAAITQTIRDTAANPQKLAKLGLGNVDAAAAVRRHSPHRPQRTKADPDGPDQRMTRKGS